MDFRSVCIVTNKISKSFGILDQHFSSDWRSFITDISPLLITDFALNMLAAIIEGIFLILHGHEAFRLKTIRLRGNLIY